MDKTTDKFCPECGHHLYRKPGSLFCVECGADVSEDDAISLHDAEPMRREFMKGGESA